MNQDQLETRFNPMRLVFLYEHETHWGDVEIHERQIRARKIHLGRHVLEPKWQQSTNIPRRRRHTNTWTEQTETVWLDKEPQTNAVMNSEKYSLRELGYPP